MPASAPVHNTPGRRRFLRGCTGDVPLRPPWALDESRFTEACTGCGDCLAACSEQVLVRGGGGLPVFDPRRGECTFCGDCAAVCKVPAFASRDSEPWTLQAHIGDACLAANGIVCASCRDACGESAIHFPPTRALPQPQVLAERCTGCGGCVSSCPVAAISLLHAPQLETVDA